jgi:hypothetical protein
VRVGVNIITAARLAAVYSASVNGGFVNGACVNGASAVIPAGGWARVRDRSPLLPRSFRWKCPRL